MRCANAGELARDATRLTPDKVVLAAPGASLTYARLDERAARVAGMLREGGLRRGDVVALATGNDWRVAELLLGTMRAGATALLVNTKLGPRALAHVLADGRARWLFADGPTGARIAAAGAGAAAERTVAVGAPVDGADDYDVLMRAAPPSPAAVRVESRDVAVLMYTSGSTGLPKGCMLTHESVWWQARSMARTMLLEAADRYLVMGPLYHANALWAGLYPMLRCGGSLALLPDFSAADALDAIERHRVTYLSGTPSMLALMLAEEERRGAVDASSLSLLLCGSAPVPDELMRRLVDRFGCDVVESYGLTEGGATVLSPRWGVKKLGSAGLPVPDVELRIVDPADGARECGPGEVGELWSRSPANTLGYLRNPDATAAKLDADGWLRTGDLASRDEQGYVFLRGRTDDMISVGGENVYPKEVEALLAAHPGVREVAVVPAAHAIKGHAPVAWVVPDRHASPGEDELRRFCLERGPAYAHPRRVFFRDALPMSPTNKVDRAALAAETAALLPDGLEGGPRHGR